MKVYYVMIIFFLLAPNLWAKVDPPNYNFSLDQIKPFFPNEPLEEAKKKYPTFKLLRTKKGIEMYRFSISYLRFNFPLFVQAREGKILDFYARLPSYFLHDVFHQSLINRLGKQDLYEKKEELATYIWKNKNGLKHVYSGTCSITCFPIFYSVYPAETSQFTPMLEQFEKHL